MDRGHNASVPVKVVADLAKPVSNLRGREGDSGTFQDQANGIAESEIPGRFLSRERQQFVDPSRLVAQGCKVFNDRRKFTDLPVDLFAPPEEVGQFVPCRLECPFITFICHNEIKHIRKVHEPQQKKYKGDSGRGLRQRLGAS